MNTLPIREAVAVLGASPKPARYSHKAIVALQKAGHHVLPINPGQSEIDGLTCYPDLASCPDKIDTITVYVNPSILIRRVDDMINVQPRRVILNPGTESDEVIERLESVGIEVDQDCTRNNRVREQLFLILNTFHLFQL